MRRWLTASVVVLIVTPILVTIGMLAFVYSGLYDVAATRQHTPAVYWALMTTLRQSIDRHARAETPPPPDLRDPQRIAAGQVLYDTSCVVCHGGPGVAPEPIGLGLTPPPANLVRAGRDWSPEELHWVVANGLKMTGMPAWKYRLTDDEIWSVIAFLKLMPALTPTEYQRSRIEILQSGQKGER